MRRARVVHLIVGLVLAAGVSAVFAASGLPDAAPGCAVHPQQAGRSWQRAAAVSGDEVVDASGTRVVDVASLDPCGDILVGAGMLRHLAAGDSGTAVVNDLAGPDQLIAVGPRGLEVIDTHGEVTHPTWSTDGRLAWSEDLQVVRIASTDRAEVHTLVPPAGTLGAFAPYFDGNDAIVAVLQEPSPATTPEDEGLNNLWRFDLDENEWSRISDFRSSESRWSAIRTPVVAPDGTVYFVRITADPSATKLPRFELWSVESDRPSRLRVLGQEMYLAGTNGTDLVWNAPSRSCRGWGLFTEGPGGLTPAGCGSVAVDPLEVDPDAEMDHHDDHEGEGGARLGIVVGDFRSAAAAGRVAPTLPDDLSTRVVDHRRARGLIQPGAWAVVVAIGDREPRDVLRQVRASLRDCRCGAWLAPLGN